MIQILDLAVEMGVGISPADFEKRQLKIKIGRKKMEDTTNIAIKRYEVNVFGLLTTSLNVV